MLHGTRVLALGSPHGDDQAGWRIVERLAREAPDIEAVALKVPADLLERVQDCTTLIVVDACRSGAEPGTIFRAAWPGGWPDGWAGLSSHGLGVAETLALAGALGRLPQRVVLLGVEIQQCSPGVGLSQPVQAALPELYRRVLAEVHLAAPNLQQRGTVFPSVTLVSAEDDHE
jgi:hydrogenase maturation protease